MPLSDYEQQMLRQMEQALYEEDPQFATQLRNHGSTGLSIRRIVVGAIGLVAGLALIMTGILQGWLWLGPVGFAVMVASVAHALWPRNRANKLAVVNADGSLSAARPAKSPRAKAARTQGTFLERMEQRWDRRRSGDS